MMGFTTQTTPDPASGPSRPTQSVPLKHLVLLSGFRVLAILGQVLAIWLTATKFGVALPLMPLGAAIGAQVCAAGLSWHRSRQSAARVTHIELFSHLAFDALLLTTVLFFSGGSTNPFVSLLLIPLVIVAATLPARYTWIMATLTTGCYTFLMVSHVPISMAMDGAETGFRLHVMGMWLGYLVAAGSVAFFAVRMAEVRRQGDEALAQLRERELTDRYVVRLGTLATGAAHELGTPLTTIAILSKDLAEEYADHPDLAKKMRTLRQQVARCKETLSVIAAEGGVPRAESGVEMVADAYLEKLLESWHKLRPDAAVDHCFKGPLPAPGVIPQPGLGQAVFNLLNNAADAGDGPVRFDASWTVTQLTLEIGDRGPGFSKDVLAAATEPFFSTKEGGMGLGLFLTKAVIDQLGGTLYLGNRDEGGAVARITLPLGLAVATR